MNKNIIAYRRPVHPGEQYLRDWRLLGPFSFRDTEFAKPQGTPAILDRAFVANEPELDPTDDSQGWHDHLRTNCYCNEMIDMLEVFEPDYISKYETFKQTDYTAFYVAAVIEAQRECDILLNVEASEYYRAWWNGQAIGGHEEGPIQGFDWNRHIVTVKMRKGINRLVIKATNFPDMWYVGAKLSAADDQPICVSSEQAASVEGDDTTISVEPTRPIQPLWIRDMAAPLVHKWSDGSVLAACHHAATSERFIQNDPGGEWQPCCPPAIHYNMVELADGTRLSIGHHTRATGNGNFITWSHRSKPHTLTFTGPQEVKINCPGARDWGADDQGRRQPSGLASFHSMIALSDGRILASCYGYWEGDTDYDEDAIRSGLPYKKLGMTKYRSFALQSTDQGRSFQYCGMIGCQMELGPEGFCEPSLVELSNGELLAVMRNGAKSRFLWQARSGDGGKTWNTPEQLPFRGVFPALKLLSNSVLVCAYVRPFLMLAIDPTGTGRAWSHNILISASQIAGGTQGGIVSIAEGEPNTVFYPLYEERQLDMPAKGLTKRTFLSIKSIRICRSR